jgi:hypothetical protein
VASRFLRWREAPTGGEPAQLARTIAYRIGRFLKGKAGSGLHDLTFAWLFHSIASVEL